VSDNKEREVIQMGRVKREVIVGVEVGQNITCLDCLNTESKDWEYQVTQDQILTQKEVDNPDELIFCDACKHRLT
jgi:uncharacterized membrane protein